ncbi:HU family DNA-binding protein [Prevotella sp.]|uniref:HU family DNA-binding protein n=1 Tax=Prevotella sp. TaxID=59823 RepID=UPI0025FF9EB8|nr:HU family DNA-binding protein [Prevotella sp.]
MALNYKIYKSTVNNGTKDKFYARASHKDTVGIKQLAAVMQNNCTVKHSDIVAVLSELSEVMKQELQRGSRVRIDGLGTFKVNIRSKGAKTAKDFTVSENILGTRINFHPETNVNPDGSHIVNMLSGIRVKEDETYESPRGKDKNTETV